MSIVRLTKLSEAPEPLYPLNIEVGFIKEGLFVFPPKVGECFWVGNAWSTSTVQEIINDNTFRTYNSIYKWETLPDL